MKQTAAKFGIGQLVRHKLFNYRGVVVDIDPFFKGTEQWDQGMAKSKPHETSAVTTFSLMTILSIYMSLKEI